VTPESIAAVERIMMEIRQVTVDDISALLDTSHGSAHHIIHDVFQFHKVSQSGCHGSVLKQKVMAS
jgi:hypothetical protein